MTYDEFKEKLSEHREHLVLAGCFVLVFFVGFGAGRFEKQLRRERNIQKNYTTNQAPKPKATGGVGEVVPVAAATTTPPSTPAGTPSCVVKGNIGSGGKKIYHVPGGASYNVVKPEQCFATEAEAEAAGYVKSGR